MNVRPLALGPVLFLLFALLLASALLPGAVSADPVIGVPVGAVPGDSGRDSTRDVYDLAGILSPEEIATLETRAQAIHQLGHPVVVYIHKKEASFEETVQDARRLMDVWNVQTGPEARDGIVILLNLRPADPAHGSYAVVAGQSLIHGSVPQFELDRVAAAMRPILKEGRIAGAVEMGLERMEQDIRQGPPPPPPPNPAVLWARSVARGPMSAASVLSLLAATFGIWLMRRWSPPRRAKSMPSSTPEPPSPLPPALAGALVSGSVDDGDIAATILDLARRGALAIEPEEKKKSQLHLLDESRVRPGYERKLWEILAAQADGGRVSSRSMDKVRSGWSGLLQEIRSDLVARGWFDPEARQKRLPLLLLMFGLSFLCTIAAIIAALSRSPFAWIGTVALAVASGLAAIAAARVPNTTESGEQAAVPWRGYRAHIERTGKNPKMELDLETAVPYALGFGIGQTLNKRLQAASKGGVLPSWLGPSDGGAWDGGFYPYWLSFNSSVAPSSSGASSAGASAGSGASGGSF